VFDSSIFLFNCNVNTSFEPDLVGHSINTFLFALTVSKNYITLQLAAIDESIFVLTFFANFLIEVLRDVLSNASRVHNSISSHNNWTDANLNVFLSLDGLSNILI
jgi:hypothetical protein